jgi:hypothetical protein
MGKGSRFGCLRARGRRRSGVEKISHALGLFALSLSPDILKFPNRCFEASEKQTLFSMRWLVPNLPHLSPNIYRCLP